MLSQVDKKVSHKSSIPCHLGKEIYIFLGMSVGCFGKRLAFDLGDREKHIALPKVGGHYLIH